MSSLVYLLRHPAHTISSALYLPDDGAILTLGVENAAPSSKAASAAQVLRAGESSRVKAGQLLTATKLMEILVEANKVITL